ncbi:MAG: hypothetical protein ACD_42C00448G0001 [uncultured bacterium]|nr:MAG: hypothetical protein ACD_42C00448G0001 [uncultured bacterium]OGT34374.1 MAG: thiol reductant ABC exporter subunit CydC [Gammaproteobacteria bacterium RIFCSPHIGHO2_02_FULL_39_13]OGT50465.1 MAG: thiol reductant ABC exporter subunit CydC [Gammaproteobacteria bacterium RIFCSPHIGHO2_12_FULL_39_24]
MKSLLFFLKKLSEYKMQLLGGIALSLILTVASITLLSLSGWFITASALAGLTATSAVAFNYFIPAACIRFLALTRILSRYFDRVVNHDFTFKILSTLRVWFYQKLIPQAPAQLLTYRSGDLLNRIIHDINTLDHLYLNIASPLIIAFFIVVSVTLFIGHFSLSLSVWIIIALLTSMISIPLFIFKKSLAIGSRIQQATSDLRTQTIDFMQGFLDVLLFTKKENRLDFIFNANANLTSAQKLSAQQKAITLSLMQLLSGFTVWFSLLLGIPLVINHTITGAVLTMIILLLIVSYEQLLSLPTAFLALGKTKQAADRLLWIAHKTPSVIFPEQSITVKQYSIAFENVLFSYPNAILPTAKNISFHIPQQSIFAIGGDSGSGKTTLLHLIARIWDPTVGKISIGNDSLPHFSENDLRNTISYVTQQVHIFNASVRDNITLMQNGYSDDHLFSVLEKMDLAHHIKNLPDGLDTEMGEFGKNFSGGQIRRIAIARALLANTPIILLDEPSTGLDTLLFEKIWKNCEADFHHKTIVIATHDLNLLSKATNRFLLH